MTPSPAWPSNPPRILFCSSNALDPTLGASKVILEVAAELRALKWHCVLAADTEICPGIAAHTPEARATRFKPALRAYLQRHAGAYDVVEYDHWALPYPRREVNASTLCVARSVLLIQHVERIRVPRLVGRNETVARWVRGPFRRRHEREQIASADTTCREADLINVSNDDDQVELVRRGIAPGKIVVIPFGLTDDGWDRFQRVTPAPSPTPTVAFVGTFDGRKGAREFPAIVRQVAASVPTVRFKILGTRYREPADVLAHFPPGLHRHLQIERHFAPEDLAERLADCWVGMFPSYVEGFGFGVLEMLAAGVPVVAYRAPGPPMMLTDEFLVPPGDAGALASKIVQLLGDEAGRRRAREWARRRAGDFRWRTFAEETSQAYLSRLARLRSRK